MGVAGADDTVADFVFIGGFFVTNIPRLALPKSFGRFGGLPFEESFDTLSTSRSVNT
jgi:hypothetical protein